MAEVKKGNAKLNELSSLRRFLLKRVAWARTVELDQNRELIFRVLLTEFTEGIVIKTVGSQEIWLFQLAHSPEKF